MADTRGDWDHDSATYDLDMVVIDRARFERLREYVVTRREFERLRESDHGANWQAVFAARDRFFATESALLPTDTDPLTE